MGQSIKVVETGYSGLDGPGRDHRAGRIGVGNTMDPPGIDVIDRQGVCNETPEDVVSDAS